jgi:FixJ family two-component response regulator
MILPETRPRTEPGTGETVVIVDDDASIREALLALMESIGMHALAYGSVQEFLDAPPVHGPQCIVLDVRMPGRSGLDLQTELARRDHAPPIIFLTGHADVPMSVRAMKAGAIEFLMKPFRDQDLIDAIHEGMERDRQQLTEQVALGALRARYESLTPRAREVLQHVAQGLLNKQIAGLLDVSEITVKVHRGQVMRKMGAKSVAELVRMADVLGIIPASR